MSSDPYTQIAAIASAVIATCAFVISWWQLSTQRKHNRLSVVPKLDVTTIVREVPHAWLLSNRGVGPAIITGFRIYVGKMELTFPDHAHFDAALEGIGCGDYQISTTLQQGDYVPVGEERKMLVFDPSVAVKARDKLKKIRWVISYRSIYGDTYQTEFLANDEDA